MSNIMHENFVVFIHLVDHVKVNVDVPISNSWHFVLGVTTQNLLNGGGSTGWQVFLGGTLKRYLFVPGADYS